MVVKNSNSNNTTKISQEISRGNNATKNVESSIEQASSIVLIKEILSRENMNSEETELLSGCLKKISTIKLEKELTLRLTDGM